MDGVFSKHIQKYDNKVSSNIKENFMYKKASREIQRISNYAGESPDYVQGGGGNTSVKFDDTIMAIKASGYTLGEVTQDTGYVTVDYKKIRKYYNNVDPNAQKDFEKDTLELNLDSIVLLDGMENKRPSVEVGFHSFLQRCVIHTHSVYANILCCTVEGREIALEIFKDSGISYIFVPYVDPGFHLTLTIKDAVEAYQKENGCRPDAIFMENHGVIVSNDDAEKAIKIHDDLNQKIIKYFNLIEYPKPYIKKTQDGFESNTSYFKAFAQKHGGEDYFKTLLLYPDQLVYIGKKLGDIIQFEKGGIRYQTTEKEAGVIEETLLGVAFVVGEIKKAGLTLKQMNEKDADFINNWESEKYRSKLIK